MRVLCVFTPTGKLKYLVAPNLSKTCLVSSCLSFRESFGVSACTSGQWGLREKKLAKGASEIHVSLEPFKSRCLPQKNNRMFLQSFPSALCFVFVLLFFFLKHCTACYQAPSAEGRLLRNRLLSNPRSRIISTSFAAQGKRAPSHLQGEGGGRRKPGFKKTHPKARKCSAESPRVEVHPSFSAVLIKVTPTTEKGTERKQFRRTVSSEYKLTGFRVCFPQLRRATQAISLLELWVM